MTHTFAAQPAASMKNWRASMESFEGMSPTQSQLMRAIRQRMNVLHAEIAERTKELDELREEARAVLYGGVE